MKISFISILLFILLGTQIMSAEDDTITNDNPTHGFSKTGWLTIDHFKNTDESLKVYYEIHGDGKPMLMLHGFWPDHRLLKGCMEPVFQNRAGWKRIYFDLPGMGQTKACSCIKNSDDMLELVLTFMDHIIPEQHIVLAGESYGGYLARGVIHHRASVVDGLLLICPLIIPAASKRNCPTHVTLIEDKKLLEILSPEEIEMYGSIAVVQNLRTWERFRDEVMSGLTAADAPFLENIFTNGYAFSFDAELANIQFLKPALFVMGRQDDVVGYKDAWDILDQYPRASFVVLDQAGHNLQIEQEKLFSALVSEWLDRLDIQASTKK